jgi:hypothetical protein
MRQLFSLCYTWRFIAKVKREEGSGRNTIIMQRLIFLLEFSFVFLDKCLLSLIKRILAQITPFVENQNTAIITTKYCNKSC